MRLRLPPRRSRAPLGIAGFIAIPLFFSSLMASTLALEKPRVVQWTSGGRLLTTWHEPAPATEARIWLWALVPPLLLVVVGAVASRLPLGFYIACTAAIVDAMAVVHKTATWERHHIQRFPWGVDLIPKTNVQSNTYDPGFWEDMARSTSLSLEHWTIGLAIVCMSTMGALYVKRRFFARKVVEAYGQLEGIHAQDATQPGLGDPTA